MTVKVLGTLVGTPIAATPPQFINNFLKDGIDHTIVRDVAGMTNANVIGDQFSLGFVKSGAYLDPLGCQLWWDAFGTSVTVNIGDAGHVSGLASALSIAAAGTGVLWKTFTAAKMGQPLWQALGYGSDPGTLIELLATIAGANVVNTANLGWQIKGLHVR